MTTKSKETTEEKSTGTIVYLRCETLEEGEKAAAELRDYASKLGIEVIQALFDKSSGPPYSLLNLLRSGSLEKNRSVLVPDHNCFGREETVREAIMHMFKRKGVTVISPEKRPAIPAAERYIAAINDYYSTGGNWLAGTDRESLSDDRPTAGRTVFGYENVGGTIRIKDEDARIVKFVFSAYAQGKPMTEIKESMDDSFADNSRPSLSQLYGMIKNGVYAGVTDGAHSVYPAIIPMNIWLKCCGLNEKRSKEPADDEFILESIEYEGTKLKPLRERKGLKKRVYSSSEPDPVSFPADRIESVIINCVDSKLKNALPTLIGKCALAARNGFIKFSAQLASANSDYNNHLSSFREKYSLSRELPYGCAVSRFEQEKAGLDLERICLDYLAGKQREFSLTEEQIREYFEHLSKLGELSRYEQKYFIGSLVRKVRIRDGKLLFSLPGFEQFSVILTPENNGKSL